MACVRPHTAVMAPLSATPSASGPEALVLGHRRLARHLAQRYVRGGDQSEDLEQVAYLGLVKAARRFDPDRGVAFTTFAVPTVLGELRRHVVERGGEHGVCAAECDRGRAA